MTQNPNAQLGTVHVFNSFNEPISSLSVSGFSGGTISGWSTTATTLYTPSQLSVPRVLHQSDVNNAAFAVGDNPVIISWVSFRSTVTVTIPNPASGVSLMDDLILYLTVNKAILLTTRGYVLNVFDISTSEMDSGRALSQEEADAVAATTLGTVHVFNSFNEPISSLSVSGFNGGAIDGWSTTATTLYTPSQLSVPRVLHQSDVNNAAFAVGDNPVIISWVSFRSNATVTVPNPASGVSLLDDLILYLTVNKAILLTTRGYVLNVFDISTAQLHTGAQPLTSETTAESSS